MYDPTLLEYILLGANGLMYVLLAFQLLRRPKASQVGARSIAEAFAILGEEVKRAIPNIPPGYTWREAEREAQKMNLRVDWVKVAQATDAYEMYRYGGVDGMTSDFGEVLMLARELKRVR